MNTLGIVLTVIVGLLVLLLAMAIKVVKQYEQGVVFRLGRVTGAREPGTARHHPVRGGDAAGLQADRDDADSVARDHHS